MFNFWSISSLSCSISDLSGGGTYFGACVKLHPWREFDWDSPWVKDPIRRSCRWPGLIILCPCLRFTPRRLKDLAYQLSKLDKSARKHMSDWYQCTFTSSCRGLSYVLTISISLDEQGKVVLNLEYLIHIDKVHCDQVERRIMLCAHKNAAEKIKLEGRDCVCPGCLSCVRCLTSSTTTVSEDLQHIPFDWRENLVTPIIYCKKRMLSVGALHGPSRWARYGCLWVWIQSNSFAVAPVLLLISIDCWMLKACWAKLRSRIMLTLKSTCDQQTKWLVNPNWESFIRVNRYCKQRKADTRERAVKLGLTYITRIAALTSSLGSLCC